MESVVSQVDTRLLPPTFKRLIDALGFERTLRLLQALGGTDVSIPHGVHRRYQVHRERLHRVLDDDGIMALFAAFDDRDELTLPKADKILMQARNAELRRLWNQEGISQATLALRFALTERQVWNILHSAEWPRWRQTPQRDLFTAD